MGTESSSSAAGQTIPAGFADTTAFEAENIWEHTVNSIPDLIMILDRDHRILRVNQPTAKKLGVAPEQCVGRLCYECVHGSTAPPGLCPHSLAIADGKQHTVAIEEDRLGGYFLVTASPLLDETGRAIGSVHVARDITDQIKTQQTLRHLLEAADRERLLIGCEIHDGLTQQLAAAIMQLDAYDFHKDLNQARAAKSFAIALQLVRGCHAEARRLIEGLRLPQLEELGLLAAIENLIDETNRQTKIKVEFNHEMAMIELSPTLENNIFRIVQECVANACRHSKSEKVKVMLGQHDGQLRIEVRDWGVGFRDDRSVCGHFGLEGVRERTKIFGGHVAIESAPQEGTTVIVDLPLEQPSGPVRTS